MTGHTHEVAHWPASGSGYGVCRCGATTGVVNGKASGGWHACAACTHAWGLPGGARQDRTPERLPRQGMAVAGSDLERPHGTTATCVACGRPVFDTRDVFCADCTLDGPTLDELDDDNGRDRDEEV